MTNKKANSRLQKFLKVSALDNWSDGVLECWKKAMIR
jgi:hypothetical protein